MNKVDEIKKMLEKAHGKITIEVDGMAPHISGTINDSGMMMAAFTCLKSLELGRGKKFDEVVELMKDLNAIMGCHAEGKIDGKNL